MLMTDTSKGDALFADLVSDPIIAGKVLPIRIADSPGPQDLMSLVRMFRVLRKLKPTILHGHGAKGGLFARLLAAPLGAKAVYSPHGGSLHQVFSPFKQWVYQTIERWLAPKTDAFLFESRYSLQRFEASIGAFPEKSFLVPNGLQLPAFRSYRSRPTGLWIIGAFGLLRPLKGQDLLIRAASILRERGHEIEVRIFGDGPAKTQYEILVKELDLRGIVKLMGETASPELEMAECDVVVQPSRFESFGYSAVEAMAIGIPVVASAVGGLTEIIENGKTGLFAQELTPRAFADQIELLIKDDKLRDRLASAGREAVEQRFDVARMRQDVFEIYRKICSSIA